MKTIGLVVIATAVAQNHCIYIVTLFMPIVNTYTKLCSSNCEITM